MSKLVLLLDVLHHNFEGGRVLTEIGDHGTRALDNLLGFAGFVDLAKAAPFTELHVGLNHEERSLTRLAESTNELGVLGFVTVLGETAETTGSTIQCFACLVKSTLKSIVDKSSLQDLFQCGHNVHTVYS